MDSDIRGCVLRRAAAIALWLWAAAFALWPSAPGWAADSADLFTTAGIRYPGGFDRNTVGEVRGQVGPLTVPEEGPVRFPLESNRDVYTVLAVPRWYWTDLKVDLPEGAEVVVRGSKTVGTDGNLYIVAQELRVVSTGRLVTLRDRGGAPLWTGTRSPGGGMQPGGGQGGMAGPMRPMGGMGGGMHGGGHR
ncbi:MAG: hypothetical protein HZB55_11985 [Deltaproteobacteria bacterium]|nr:hypothetical protein [Deltaproteobacteria bacterium]